MAEVPPQLEPFLLVARSAKGTTAAQVVMDVTAAPGVYVFSELLDLPNIQELRSDTDRAKYHALLALFAYGTLKTYNNNVDAYPSLSPSQMVKLRHLTLVSLALQHRSLSYDHLMAELQVSTIRELEGLIIDVIYADLLGGKMHHDKGVLHVDWAAGRDVRKEDLAAIQSGLQNWCGTASSLLRALDEQIDQTRLTSQQDTEVLAAYNAQRNQLYAALADGKDNGHGSGSKRQTREKGMGEMNADDVLSNIMVGRGNDAGGRIPSGYSDTPATRSSKRHRD